MKLRNFAFGIKYINVRRGKLNLRTGETIAGEFSSIVSKWQAYKFL